MHEEDAMLHQIQNLFIHIGATTSLNRRESQQRYARKRREHMAVEIRNEVDFEDAATLSQYFAEEDWYTYCLFTVHSFLHKQYSIYRFFSYITL